jgi:hypothetical protein
VAEAGVNLLSRGQVAFVVEVRGFCGRSPIAFVAEAGGFCGGNFCGGGRWILFVSPAGRVLAGNRFDLWQVQLDGIGFLI